MWQRELLDKCAPLCRNGRKELIIGNVYPLFLHYLQKSRSYPSDKVAESFGILCRDSIALVQIITKVCLL